MSAKSKSGYYKLDYKKHGVGGLIRQKPVYRKQDKRAESAVYYGVVFFPKIAGIGKAHVKIFGVRDTLSQSPAVAIASFLDGMAPGQTWKSLHAAGHRVRKLRIVDQGDAS